MTNIHDVKVDSIVKLIGWSAEEIGKLDEINTSWIDITNHFINKRKC